MPPPCKILNTRIRNSYPVVHLTPANPAFSIQYKFYPSFVPEAGELPAAVLQRNPWLVVFGARPDSLHLFGPDHVLFN